MKKKYTALGHCNISLGIYLDSIFSLHGKNAALDIINNYEPKDNPFEGRPFLHNEIETVVFSHNQWVQSEKDRYLLTGMAPVTKKKIFNFFLDHFSIESNQYVSLIHSDALISHEVELGEGVFISSGGVVAQYSKLGKFVSVQRNVIIEHHTEIGEYTSIFSGSNIAAKCKIGKNVTVCMGAIILNGLEIGDNAVIGSGALVTKSVPANTLVYGSPAKVIRTI